MPHGPDHRHHDPRPSLEGPVPDARVVSLNTRNHDACPGTSVVGNMSSRIRVSGPSVEVQLNFENYFSEFKHRFSLTRKNLPFNFFSSDSSAEEYGNYFSTRDFS